MSDMPGVAGATIAPGEHRIRREGTASEVRIPWSQYTRLVLAMGVLFGAGTIVLALIGPWTLYVIGWGGVGLLLGASQRVGRRLSPARAAVTIAVVTCGLAWALHGPGICREAWIFPIIELHPAIKMWLIAGLLAIVCAPTAWVAYRFAAEIADPSGPTSPRAAVERTGPTWPWTSEPRAPGPDPQEIRKMMEEMLRSQDRRTMQVEVAEADDGRVRVGQSLQISDLPVSREQMALIVRAISGKGLRWSRRNVAQVNGIGSDKARDLMIALVGRGFLHYPNGRNHPDGAQPTNRGRAFFERVREQI